MGDREEVEGQETAFEGSFGKSPALGCCLVQVAVSASVLGSLPLPMTQHGHCGVGSSFCSFHGLRATVSWLIHGLTFRRLDRSEKQALLTAHPSSLLFGRADG